MSRTIQRLIIAGVIVLALVGGLVAALVIADDDEGDTTQVTDPGTDVVSVAEGASARAEQAAALSQVKAAAAERVESAVSAAGASTSSDAAISAPAPLGLPVDCGADFEPYVPTPEDLAAANADTDGLAEVFDRFGVSYTRLADDYGYAWLEYDYEDVIAESVAASYWTALYPVQPPTVDELAANRAETDALAAAFDAAGVAYTRNSDESGWEWVEWDYEDPAAQAAADQVYGELYPPEPIPPEELDRIRAENDGLAAAFDAAGVAYTRTSDESGWEWVEWDYEDATAQQTVEQYFATLYPVEPCLGGPATDLPAPDDAVVSGPVQTEPGDPDDAVTSGPVEAEPAEPARPVEPGIAVDEPIPAEELDRIQAENDGLAAALDAAGVAYTRGSDESGWEWIDWDYENPEAQRVVEAYYDELYAPDPALVAAREAAVAALTGAFIDAGIDYEVRGESPYQALIFDLDAPGAPDAVAAARTAG